MSKIKHKKLTIGRMLGLALLFAVALVTVRHMAYADPPTITQTAWPTGFPLPQVSLYTHGNGAVTIAGNGSSYTNATPVLRTLDSSDLTTAEQTISYDTGGWRAQSPDLSSRLVGTDGTIYFVQQQNTTTTPQRIVAMRNGQTLWTGSVLSTCNNNKPAYLSRLALGFDGNIYALATDNLCSLATKSRLVSFAASTGAVRFTAVLPASNPAASDKIMSYQDGVTISNNGANIYYYTYSGVLESSKAFSPTLPTGMQDASVAYASVHPNGKAFMGVVGNTSPTGYNTTFVAYYKDPSSSTISQVSIPNRTITSIKNITATPDEGFAMLIADGSNDRYLEYFDDSGSRVFEKPLSSDSEGYSPSVASFINLAIDNLGNAIVTKAYKQSSNPNDMVVLIDSYNPSGIKTRLFDSGQSFGSSIVEQFSLPYMEAETYGDGKLYLALCHTLYSYQVDCTNASTTKIVTVPMAGSFDYPRSAMFDQAAQRKNYIAMGDSYSAGEGLNPFIPPSDTSECDRSYQAYPSLLTANSSLNLDLRAFVACSGHTTIDMATSQLAALSDSTDIVTLTAGGNDALFKDFAKECVINTCDATSSEYQATMDVIDNDLQDSVENLLTGIRTSAPNAVVYVMGYPNVVPTGSACSFFSLGEEIAANTVVTGINNKLQLAVQNMGSGFTFLDPTAAGSPFLGHELCSSDPYFFGLNIAEHRFSFHPNADGQAAYASMVEAAL